MIIGLSVCAGPIGVTRVSPRSSYKLSTDNVLGEGKMNSIKFPWRQSGPCQKLARPMTAGISSSPFLVVDIMAYLVRQRSPYQAENHQWLSLRDNHKTKYYPTSFFPYRPEYQTGCGNGKLTGAFRGSCRPVAAGQLRASAAAPVARSVASNTVVQKPSASGSSTASEAFSGL